MQPKLYALYDCDAMFCFLKYQPRCMQAIIVSISNMNTMLENYTSSVDDIYKAAIVIQKDVLSAIVSLVNGTVTLDDFNEANSFENLVRALNETSLPEGSIRDPLDDSTTSGDTHSSSSLALVCYVQYTCI